MNKEENIKEDLLKPILIEDLGTMFPTENSKRKFRFGLYKCGFCGEEFRTQIRSVKNGDTKSCGCLKEKISKEGTNRKHSLTNTRIYVIWRNIKNRTLNLKHKNYIDYGGRGITICDKWENDFMSFYDWAMLNGYSDELSIDRIDNNRDYSPENCRWTTSTIQNRNKRVRKDNTSGYKGVYYMKANKKFRAQIKVNKKNIHLGYFQTAEDGAVAYNNYIIENNLEGFILNKIER